MNTRARKPAVIGLAIFAAAALLFVPLVGLAENDHTDHSATARPAATTQPTEGKKNEMAAKHLATMAKLQSLLAEAKGAADSNDAETAAKKIAEAQVLLEKQHQAMHKHMKAKGATCGDKPAGQCPMCQAAPQVSAKIVNARCPMMGSTLKPEKVTEKLTREFKGRKVGFCCGGCPTAWDSLSDEQKEAKLKNAAAK